MKGLQVWAAKAEEQMVVKLRCNPYPGRGIVIGTSEDGLYAVQVYWIMGRSDNSRNRIFATEGGRLFTEAADPSKMKDPALVIYNAMREYHRSFVVSNGDQTDTVAEELDFSADITLSDALMNRVYEPDVPNYTPRITGMCTIDNDGICSAELAILRKSELAVEWESGDDCQRFYYQLGHIAPGFGFCVTTYMGDGNPLPAFTGEPYPVLLHGDIGQVIMNYWQLLNPDNRVSIAVKFIEIATGKFQIEIVNKYSRVVPSPAA